jgi:AcrR family transcriptional regulator
MPVDHYRPSGWWSRRGSGGPEVGVGSKELTRGRLLVAARDIVSSDGYQAASVVAIAERAGVATGTLYRHYASKPHLFVEVFRAVCDREVEAAIVAAQRPGTVVERLLAVVETFARRALLRPRLAWALIAEPVDELVADARLAYRRSYRDRIADALQAAISAGEIPAQDVTLVAAAIVGGAADALVGPVSPVETGMRTDDEVVETILLFVARAIGAVDR